MSSFVIGDKYIVKFLCAFTRICPQNQQA